MTGLRLAGWLFCSAMRLLPDSIQREYGPDIHATFCRRLCERHGWRRIWYVVRETAGLVRVALVERIQARSRGPKRSQRRRWDVLHGNLRAGWSTLRRSPGFTAVAVLILGCGIGLTTAVFSALDAVLLRPSPYVDAEELVNVERTAGEVSSVIPWPHDHYRHVRDRGGPFRDVAAYGTYDVTLTGEREPVRIGMEFVSDNYLTLLGVPPHLGVGFEPGQAERAVAEREVLLSHAAWRERFAGRPALGAALTVNGKTVVVAGVLPPGFHGESGDAELFAPIGLAPDVVGDASLMQPYVMWLNVVARLREDVTPAIASDHLMVMNDALLAEGEYPISLGGAPVAVTPLHGSRIDPAFRRALVLTFGAAALVMMIVCLNISSLLLVRTQGRERELAIRGVIGATRGRLMGQLVTESLLLAVAGGLAGLVIARIMLGVLTALRPAPTPGFWSSYARALDVHAFQLDTRVLMFAAVLTLLAGTISGLLPALRAGASDFASRVRGEAGWAQSGGRGWNRARSGIVIAEIALAFVLVTAAGLVASSLAHMHREDLGFNRPEVVTMRLQLPSSTHTLAQASQFYTRLQHELEVMPGASSVAMSTGLPVTSVGGTTDFVPEGRADEDLPTIRVGIVSRAYFETLGIPIRTGTAFDPAGGRISAVISAAAAHRYWPGENPVGRRAYAYVGTRSEELVEIVGVVGDVQYGGVGDDVDPVVYLPMSELPVRNAYVSVGTSQPPAATAAAMRAAVSRLDPLLAITEIRTMHERVGSATSRARFSAVVITAFAVLAAFLAMLGVYGLVAYSVRTRTHEFGVRLALGSRPGSLIGLMLRDVSTLAAVGLGVGLAGSIMVAGLMQSQLYGVSATDVRILALVAAAMFAAAASAAWLPARRVLRISASAELMRN